MNKNLFEENIEKEGMNVYQIQPYNQTPGENMTNKIIVRNVGKFVKIHDVLINKFNLNENIECVIANTIYTENEIGKAIDNGTLNMFKIYLNYCKGNYKNEIGIMMTNFNMNSSKLNDYGIYDGKFVIVFACDNNCIILDKTPSFVSHNYYIGKMIKLLMDEQINKIIMDKIKKY